MLANQKQNNKKRMKAVPSPDARRQDATQASIKQKTSQGRSANSKRSNRRRRESAPSPTAHNKEQREESASSPTKHTATINKKNQHPQRPRTHRRPTDHMQLQVRHTNSVLNFDLFIGIKPEKQQNHKYHKKK
jgi:hypothetical protein